MAPSYSQTGGLITREVQKAVAGFKLEGYFTIKDLGINYCSHQAIRRTLRKMNCVDYEQVRINRVEYWRHSDPPIGIHPLPAIKEPCKGCHYAQTTPTSGCVIYEANAMGTKLAL